MILGLLFWKGDHMGLVLGKVFNRNYNVRIPLLDGFYNIGIFFNNKSTFLLFSIEPDFSTSKEIKHNSKILMFKNLESSSFASTFLNLHNYRSQSLDIVNQFKNIKGEYTNDVINVLNEDIILSEVREEDNVWYDHLLIYGFTLSSYPNDFLFILTERHNLVPKLKKKIVRTSGIQIATTPSLDLIEEYNKEMIESNKIYKEGKSKADQTIKL